LVRQLIFVLLAAGSLLGAGCGPEPGTEGKTVTGQEYNETVNAGLSDEEKALQQKFIQDNAVPGAQGSK
jgi:hypothetical protein